MVKLLEGSDKARESIELQPGNNGNIALDTAGAVVIGIPWKPAQGVCGAAGKYIGCTGPETGRG